MGQSRIKLSTGLAAAAVAMGVAVPVTATAHSTSATSTTTTPTATTGSSATPAGAVAVNSPCYVDTPAGSAEVSVSGTDWAPGDTIQLTDSLQHVLTTVTVSSAGTFSATVPTPIVPVSDAEVSDRIQALDEGSQGATSSGGPSAQSASFLTTRYEVKRIGTTSDPFAKSTFALSGFRPGRTVYAHYLTRRGTLLATTAVGRPTGACGTRQVRAYEYPGGKARLGRYTIQFDDSARYSARTAPQYRVPVDISHL